MATLAACAGGASQAPTPAAPAALPAATAASPAASPSIPESTPLVASSAVVPAASGGTAVAAALPAAVADSAADDEVLEELRGAAPAEGAADERGNPAPTGGAEATDAAVVTWDIDVTSFLSHERVQYYLDFFQGPARERFGAWLQRMPRYEPMIRARLARQGLPGDLLYLALIESGFSNSATSRARAVGMWQFMPSTGRQYGLRVDRWVDERRDPVKATDAAARHLDDLRERFGSLYLAAAAYNAGGGKVSKGLRRLGDGPEEDGAEEDLTSDSTFFLLYDTRYLRRETKDYVPKLIAAAIIAKEPEKYGFPRPAELPPFAYDSIVVPDATGLDVVARLAGTDVAALRDLNPQFLRLITPPGSRAIVRLPVGTGERTAAAYAELPADRRVTFKEHVVRSGETLGAIGRRYGVGVTDIRAANRNIAPNRLRIGMTLIIPVSPAFDPRAVAATEAPAAGRSGGRAVRGSGATWHTVRRGESWWSISERYGVRVGELQAWNDAGPREKLRIGQRIRVRAGGAQAPRRSGAQAAPRTAASRAAVPASPATYRVKRGDTLSEIALRYGITEAELRRLNRLSATSGVQAGKVLKLR
ncbi:MAG TPA: LysM peptidoglycan-binding domain-containing protein [Gemmatimonadales bacterium]|nr:LysM peptidoglycan-binding domain-containing protein [Gemmatimonadales bacterium]